MTARLFTKQNNKQKEVLNINNVNFIGTSKEKFCIYSKDLKIIKKDESAIEYIDYIANIKTQFAITCDTKINKIIIEK